MLSLFKALSLKITVELVLFLILFKKFQYTGYAFIHYPGRSLYKECKGKTDRFKLRALLDQIFLVMCDEGTWFKNIRHFGNVCRLIQSLIVFNRLLSFDE